jgi:tetratricopeptide (TPR) repeat protein
LAREKALEPEHPDVATSLDNLANLYGTQGLYAEAEPLYKRSLAVVEKALGPKHPYLATILEKYADILRKIGREADAVKLEGQAQKIHNKHVREKPEG